MAEAANIFESISEPFTCPICSGTLTAARPPSLNLDNCSCPDANGSGEDPPGELGLEARYPVSNAESMRTNASSASVPMQTGVKQLKEPNNRNPPRVPEHTLVHNVNGESNHSYALDRYLRAINPMERSYHGPWTDNQPDASWLLQDRLITGRRESRSSSTMGRKGRSSVATCTSYRSSSRTSGKRSACRTLGSGSSARLDDCAGAGDWTPLVEAHLYKSNIWDEDLSGV